MATDVATVRVRRPVERRAAPSPLWRARGTRWRWMMAPAALAIGIRATLLLALDVVLRMLIAAGMLAPTRYYGLIGSWAVFDGRWYTHIAQFGYDTPPPKNLVDFFPLYPMLIRLLGVPLAALGVNNAYVLAGLLISWAAFIAACVLFYRLALPRLGRDGALLAVGLLATFPFGFFYGAAYTEAVFLLLAVGAFLAIERQGWAVAALLAMFAGALRPPGVLLGITVVIAYGVGRLQQRRWPGRDVLWLALTPAGALAYFTYCWLRFGDFLAYQHASVRGWHGGMLQWGGIDAAFTSLLNVGTLFTSPRFTPLLYILYALLALLFLMLCFPIWRWYGPHYAFFVASGIVIPLATFPSESSLGRYLSVLFPVFLVAAELLRRRPVARQLVIFASTTFLCLMCLLFLLGKLD